MISPRKKHPTTLDIPVANNGVGIINPTIYRAFAPKNPPPATNPIDFGCTISSMVLFIDLN